MGGESVTEYEIFQNGGSIPMFLSKIKTDVHLTAWTGHKETNFIKEIASQLHANTGDTVFPNKKIAQVFHY